MNFDHVRLEGNSAFQETLTFSGLLIFASTALYTHTLYSTQFISEDVETSLVEGTPVLIISEVGFISRIQWGSFLYAMHESPHSDDCTVDR